jgi:uncharacterized membrane protein
LDERDHVSKCIAQFIGASGGLPQSGASAGERKNTATKEVGMNGDSALILAIAIGVVAGLRSFTAPAAVSWAAHLGWLNLEDSPLALMGTTAAVIILSVLAAAEYVVDILPNTPARIRPGPLTGRILLGGLSGAVLCASAHHSPFLGAVLGGFGGVIGAFVGYEARRRLVSGLKVKDLGVAILEDMVAIGLAYFIVSAR